MAKTVLANILNQGHKFSPTSIVKLIKDEADNRLLELAESCKADYLVTGNTKDFTFSEFRQTKIISPKDFFNLLDQ